MNGGILSFRLSSKREPASVRTYCRAKKIASANRIKVNHQKLITKLDIPIKIDVKTGKVFFISEYNLATCGTIVTIINTPTATITARTIPGYTIAPRILLTIAASFSCWSAIRFSASSSVPDASPAVTSAMKILLNTSGCLPKAEDNVLPPSTSAMISWTISCIFLLAVCSNTVCRLCVNGNPAPINVASWREKTILSLLEIRLVKRASQPPSTSSLIDSGI